MDIKDALLLYKDVSHRQKLDLNEFSAEIRDYIHSSTDNLKFKAEKYLEEELKKSGWYNSLLPLRSEILHILLEFKFQSCRQEIHLVTKVLLKAPITAFKFHFSGNRPTNRIEKPEWLLKFVFGLMEEVSGWIETQVQVLVKINGFNVFDDFILGFLLEIMDKYKKEISKISDSPVVMHLVQEILNFDLKLRDKFGTKHSLLRMMFNGDIFLEIWTRMKLKENLEKLKSWITQENAWERDLNGDSVVCCSMMIGLIESIIVSLDQKRYFFNEIFLVILESFKGSIQEKKEKMDIIFKPIKSEVASLSGVCKRLSSLGGYHLGLVQVNQWLDVWSNDMILVLELDDDENVFENICQEFISLQLQIELMFYEEFSVILENSMYDFKYKMGPLDADIDIVSPGFASVCLVIDTIFENLQGSWSKLAFERMRDKMIGILEAELNSCRIKKYDLEKGLLPILSKRGLSNPKKLEFVNESVKSISFF